MKAALLYGLQDLRLVDVPIPALTPKSVLIKVDACGICPSDIRKFHTIYSGQLKLPENMGHEYVGTVVAIGNEVDKFEIGMRIAGDGSGGYSEYALIDLSLDPSIHDPMPLIISETISDNVATFIEPLACCIHAVKDRAKVSSDQTILIVGGGTMGQLNLIAAKSVGARVIMSEPYAPIREMALALGADIVIDPQETKLSELIRNINKNKLVDAAILAIGNPSSVKEVIESVRPCGKVVLFGRFPPGATIEIDPYYLYRTEIELTGSYWIGGDPQYTHLERYGDALAIIENHTMMIEKLVSRTYKLSQIYKAFADAMSMETFKVILLPNDDSDE